MRGEEKKTTRRIAVSALLAALGVVLLLLGSFVQVLDLSMAVIASLLVVFAVIEIGGKYPMLIYAVTSVLSLLLLPVKTAALIYLAFAGYYPILKAVLEGRLTKLLAWALKLVIFCAAVAAALFVAGKLLLMDLSWVFANWWFLICLLPVFVLYDVALTRLISAYLSKWRPRLRLPDLR
jgi:hypothetical protein